MTTNLERLEVYRLAAKLGSAVWECVGTWDRFSKDTLGKQLVRAADSVAANIAEGSGRWSKADFRRFLYIARGSLYETKHRLGCARDRGLLTDDATDALAPLMRALPPMLNALIGWLGQAGPPRVSEPDSTYEPHAGDPF